MLEALGSKKAIPHQTSLSEAKASLNRVNVSHFNYTSRLLVYSSTNVYDCDKFEILIRRGKPFATDPKRSDEMLLYYSTSSDEKRDLEARYIGKIPLHNTFTEKDKAVRRD
jgi:hypothetical protein